MRLLGFQERPGVAIPEASAEEKHIGLWVDDPDLYAGLLAHWIAGDGRLQAFERGLRTAETAVILTGQQPALLGGPLYTLYKTFTAVVAARRLREAGRSAIAAFWCVGDDTDHDEVASASWPRPAAVPARARDERDAGGARIGGLDVGRMRPAIERIAADWPLAGSVHTLLSDIAAASASEGWSGFLRRTLLRLVGEEPLLFVDGNDPKVVEASQGLLKRFVRGRAALAEEIDALAAAMRARGESPALSGTQALRCLFVLDRAGRRVLEEDGEPGAGELLLPNVLLRPLLQEHLLPVHRVVCGEAEIAYRRLLAPVYERVGRPAAGLMNRFSATVFPSRWGQDPEAPDPEAVLHDPDGALDHWARTRLDPDTTRRLGDLRRHVARDLELLQRPLAGVDRSLGQVLDSISGKIDYQIRRLEDAILAKGRHALLRDEPELAHLREFLRPRGKLQERVFTMWTPLLYEGEPVLHDIRQAIEVWFSRGESGHALLSRNPEE